MPIDSLLSILFLTIGVVYLLFLFQAWRVTVQNPQATRWFLVYLASTSAWLGIEAMLRQGWLPSITRQASLAAYVVVSLSFLYHLVSQRFLRLEQPLGRRWLIAAAVGGGILLILESGLLPWPEIQIAGRRWLARDQTLLTLLLVWLISMSHSLLQARSAYSQTRRHPLHRNRVTFWSLSLIPLALGDLLVITGAAEVGILLRLPATLLVTYAVVNFDLLDMGRLLRQSAIFALVTVLLSLLFSTAFNIMSSLFSTSQTLLKFGTLAIAILFMYLFRPLVRNFERILPRWTPDLGYNPNALLSEYSLRISNIVELSRLEATAVSLISEAMGIQHGTLFLVDRRRDEQIGLDAFEFRSVQSFGPERLVLGSLLAVGPISQYFSDNRKPLTQYAIDLWPQFNETRADEREWLRGLDVEVFVPIYAQSNWIGLFGLGPKVSGRRYFEEDLLLLSTLADQTAVALENARLFENLVHVNKDLQDAYAMLAEANTQLQEIDRLKSAFVSVVTHELRTPFANIGFAIHLLERYGTEGWSDEQRQEMDNVKGSVEKADVMVNDLVKFAAFLSKQGELRYQTVLIGSLVNEVLLPLRALAEKAALHLTVSAADDSLTAEVDAERIKEALHHLVHNAIKFTPPGGHIDVRFWADEKFTFWCVQDDGKGIPSSRLPNLWDGFAQMADPQLRGTEGLGLGLALVQFVVSAHGGEVWATSEEGSGSTFGFQVPLAKMTPVPAPA